MEKNKPNISIKNKPQCREMEVMDTKVDNQPVPVIYEIGVLFPGEKSPDEV